MTRRPGKRRFSVFEFNEEDERVEKASEKLLGKFGNPKRTLHFSSPVTKYKFLQSIAGCTGTPEKRSCAQPVDLDVDADMAPINVDAEGLTKSPCKGVADGLVCIDADDEGDDRNYSGHIKNPRTLPQSSFAVEDGILQLDAIVISSSSSHKNVPAGMVLDDDDDERTEMSSLSASGSTFAGKEVPSQEQVATCEPIGLGHVIDYSNMTVVVFPDFILYGDIYCTASCLTFSCSFIKVEGSAVNGVKGTFNAQWNIGDITRIESEWCGTMETAVVNLHFKSKAFKGAGNANETPGTEKLKFSVYDPLWSEGQEAIKSLDARYRNIWDVTFGSDREKDEISILGHNDIGISKSYSSIHDETFGDIVYPKGDPDAVSISKRDVELLQPEAFINDTIIDFYIKYLKNKIQPEDQHRFHFFNSFFFRKLADLNKAPSSACGGRASFECVRKWTRNVDIFKKDYIFIPVNYSLHWSMIVICHPGEVAQFTDAEIENSLKVPCFLHMDSIRGSHRGLKNLVRSYLFEEWKERHNGTVDEISQKFLHLRFIPLELPQQENSFDCGLFLLHYVELFLEEVPTNFNPFKISNFSNFLKKNWFPPREASQKRARIQNLIYEVLEEQSQKVSTMCSSENNLSSQYAGTNEAETGVEFLKNICSSPKTSQGCYSSPSVEPRIGISHLALSSQRVMQQDIREATFSSTEFCKPGTSARQFFSGNYRQSEACHPSFMSPIEEAEETSKQTSDSSDCQCTTVLKTESPRAVGKFQKQIFVNLEELCDDDLSCETSSGSLKSSEIGKDEVLDPEIQGFNNTTGSDKHEFSLSSSEDLTACVVEDSEEEENSQDSKLGKCPPCIEVFDSNEKIGEEDKKPIINVYSVSDSDEQVEKSPRDTFCEDERRFPIHPVVNLR